MNGLHPAHLPNRPCKSVGPTLCRVHSEIFGFKYHCINRSVKNSGSQPRIYGEFIFLETDFGYLLLKSQAQNRETVNTWLTWTCVSHYLQTWQLYAIFFKREIINIVQANIKIFSFFVINPWTINAEKVFSVKGCDSQVWSQGTGCRISKQLKIRTSTVEIQPDRIS